MPLFEKKILIKNEIDYEKLAQVLSQKKQVEIDYDKLAETIVKAQDMIKEKTVKERQQEESEQLMEWQRKIGYIDYPQDEKWIKKLFHRIKNFFAVLSKILFFKPGYADKPRVSFELMRITIHFMFELYERFLYICTLFLFILFVGATVSSSSILTCVSFLIFTFVSFFIARIIRIAKLETECMNDKDTLNTVFSANMAFIGVILAIVAIIVEMT